MRHICFVACILISFKVKSQTIFQKVFGGVNEEFAYSLSPTSDGGFIVVGTTNSYGTGLDEVYLVKLNESADTLWTKTYGELGNANEVGLFVQETNDGGFIISGYTDLNDPSLDTYILKTDLNGNFIWGMVYGSPGHSVGKCIKCTSDGSYIITGYAYNSPIPGNTSVSLNKISSNGSMLWQKILFNGGVGQFLSTNSDGSLIVTGYENAYGAGAADVFLIKTDSLGNVLFAKTFSGNNDEKGNFVQQTADRGYIIVGTTSSFGNSGEDILAIKTDSLGNVIWTRTFGGPYIDQGNTAEETLDGGFIIGGASNSFGLGDFDACLVKTDNNGLTKWMKTYGTANNDYGYSVHQTEDRGYILAGHTGTLNSDAYLLKTDSLGNSGCNESVVSANNNLVNSTNISNTTSSTLFSNAIGNISPLIGSGGIVSTLCSIGINELSSNISLRIYPNPGNGYFNLQSEDLNQEDFTVRVYDVLGKVVYVGSHIKFTMGDSFSLNIASQGAGVYHLVVTQKNDLIITRRLIIQ